jgi:nitrogen fixation protein NifZ
MLDPREPKYQWGQPVVTTMDLANDGSYPDLPEDALLAESGARGEIVQVGMHTEANVPVYLVEFPDGKIVGCLEEEIVPA